MRLYFFIIILALPSIFSAQRVIQSEETNIRSHVAYHVIGQVDDVILLYLDKGIEKEIITFDQDMVRLSTRTPSFEKRKTNVLEISSTLNSIFHVVYQYKEKSQDFFRVNTYNKSVELVDTVLISASDGKFGFSPFESLFSEDESKVAIYKIYNNEEIRIIIYDFETKETTKDKIYVFKSAFLERDLVEPLLTNDGDFLMLFEKNNTRAKREKHFALVFSLSGSTDDIKKINIPLPDVISPDIMLAYNEAKKNIGVVGLYSKNNFYESDGYFVFKENLNPREESMVVSRPFSKETAQELYGKDAKSSNKIDNLTIADVVWRGDGGVLLITEMSYDYNRQPTYANSFNGRDPYSSRSWTNHLNEDLVLLSLNNEFNQEWSKVIYKRQKSQDDQGVYSSFFTFKTPSRLRLLFNDEIKTHNTVSEYIIDSRGKLKRSSLLNTEYQSLQLRMKDALQISSTSLLVPSQKSGFLSLVKIDYDLTN